MTRAELIDKVADRGNLTHRVAESAITTIFTEMAEALAREERVELRNFGSFRPKHYRGYNGRNPSTGEIIAVPVKLLPAFRAGKVLTAGIQRKDELERM